jgi:hypothetical protein
VKNDGEPLREYGSPFPNPVCLLFNQNVAFKSIADQKTA